MVFNSEVEGLGDSGTVIPHVYMQLFLFIIIFYCGWRWLLLLSYSSLKIDILLRFSLSS